MPIYVYECSSCHKTFEVEQRITEDPLKDCTCGARGSVKRLIQPSAILFRGSGFHVTDYGSSGPNSSSEGKEPASEPSGPACSGEPAACPKCAE